VGHHAACLGRRRLSFGRGFTEEAVDTGSFYHQVPHTDILSITSRGAAIRATKSENFLDQFGNFIHALNRMQRNENDIGDLTTEYRALVLFGTNFFTPSTLRPQIELGKAVHSRMLT
jgi:hypothetical protein